MRFTISFLALLLLSACTSDVMPTAVPLLPPTATNSPSATVTPIPVPTRQATTTPVSTATPSATPNITATVVAASTANIFATYASPDGRWRAQVRVHDCVPGSEDRPYALNELVLADVKSGSEALLASQLIFCGGLGAFGLDGLFWSPSSRYFYYTNAREGAPDGCGYWERPIFRVDVSNSQSELVGGGPLAPNQTMLATWRGRELVLWDIERGEKFSAPALAAGAMPGPIAWSPDSEALVYMQTTDYCNINGKAHVVRLDLATRKQQLLLESASPHFVGVRWDRSNVITLYGFGNNRWQYDLTTGEVKQSQ